MIKNLKILLQSILFFFLTNQIVFSESLEDLANELNEIRQEIANLTPTKVDKPILSVVGKAGKPITGMILSSNENSKIVTFLPLGVPLARPQQGVLLGNSNIKDIAARRSAEQAAELIADQMRSQASIDRALKQIDKATNFMQESYSKGDVEGAIAALAVVDVAISDVANNVPYNFKSEVIEEGRKFSNEEMNKISSITKNISSNKENVYQELKENIKTATSKGLKVDEITSKIIASGLQTPKLDSYYASASKDLLRENLSDTIKYSNIIGKSSQDVDLAVRQVEVLKSGDPKKMRAFEIEKYGKAAGLNKKQIELGIQAVYDGNIELEKQISKNILKKMRSNPKYRVASFSDAQIDSMMEKEIATEKAAYLVLNSGINFSKGTNSKDLKKLVEDVEIALTGKVDIKKIEKIKYEIERSQFTITNKNQLAASLIANVNGEEYVEALHQATYGATGSVAEQAAAVEASLNGNMDAFREVTRSTNKANLNNLSLKEVNDLTKVYSDVAASEAKQATEVMKQMRIQREYSKSIKQDYVIAKHEYADMMEKHGNFIAEGKKITQDMYKAGQQAYQKMNSLQLKSLQSVSFDEIPDDFKESLNKLDKTTETALLAAKSSVEATSLAEQTSTSATQATKEAAQKTSNAVAAEASKQAAEKAAEQASEQAKQAAEKAASTAASQATEAAKQAAADAANQAAKVAKQAKQAAQAAAQAAAKEAAKAAAAQAKQTAAEAAKVAANQAAEAAKVAAEEAAKEASKVAASQVKETVQEVTKEQAADQYLKVINMSMGAWNSPERKAWMKENNKLRNMQDKAGPLSTVDIEKAKERANN